MIRQYLVECNAKGIKDFEYRKSAIKFGQSKADADHLIRVWDCDEQEVIWSNEED